ncbi:LysR family transcriptional regulator [Salinicola halophilus]|uniref:LysR family transcriptional regulator n=1 Tax=Salinicola halophilus TaxID=184065 RepID=UPI000DA23753|nr:LysR family transcriptional regulator [Salinicola halophilus]
MLNLTHWRLVVSIADTGTISQAAENVGMTQSGASQALAQLEKHLGMKLFSRSHRQMVVTAFGEQVVEQARNMLMHHCAIRDLANRLGGPGSARLKLGSFPSIISTLLPKILRSFHQRYPDIEVVALEGTDEEVEEWLDHQHIDFGVVLNPEPARHAIVLGRDAWVALLPTTHPLSRRSTRQGVDLSELVHEPFILATGGCSVHAQSLARSRSLELTDIRVSVQSWDSACALVREGMGIALVPESLLPEQMKGLRALPLSPSVDRTFGLVRSTDTSVNKAADAFRQHVNVVKS